MHQAMLLALNDDGSFWLCNKGSMRATSAACWSGNDYAECLLNL